MAKKMIKGAKVQKVSNNKRNTNIDDISEITQRLNKLERDIHAVHYEAKLDVKGLAEIVKGIGDNVITLNKSMRDVIFAIIKTRLDIEGLRKIKSKVKKEGKVKKVLDKQKK